MEFTIFRTETVVSKTVVEAASAEAAIKFARAAEHTPAKPIYDEISRRSFRLSFDDPTEDKGTPSTEEKTSGSKTKELFAK